MGHITQTDFTAGSCSLIGPQSPLLCISGLPVVVQGLFRLFL